MFAPSDLNVPQHLSNKLFQFEVLAPNLAELDYEAVMSSKKRLRKIFSENDRWPEDTMSFESNKNDLLVHEDEFRARKAFAYAVFDRSKDNYIGCVYIDPTQFPGYDCEVYLWVKDSEANLDQALFESVDYWLKDVWSFKQIAYPGRTITWEDWSRR